jgi:hypothetical protein
MNATASNNYAWVWSDGTVIGSSADNEFTVYAGNGIRLLGGPITGNGSGLTNVNAATLGGVALAGLVQTQELTNASNTLAQATASKLSTNYNGAWLVGSGGSTNITGGGTWTLNAGTWTYAPTFTGLNIQTNGATAHGNASTLNLTTGPGLTRTVTSNSASTATLDLQLDNARTNYFAYVNSSNYVWTTYADTLLSNLWLITTINGVNVNTNTLPNR